MVDVSRPLARTGLLALVTALTVELVRASGPMLDRAFSAGVVVVALTALGTYVAPGVVVLALARLRPVTGRTTLVGVALLALARLAVQATGGVPRYWLALGAAAVAVGVLVAVVHLVAGDDGDRERAASRRAALAVATGVGLAAAVSLALGTWDALWQTGAEGWVPTVLVVGATLWCAWRVRGAAAVTPPRRLWVLGPYLALMIMVAGNPAYLASQLGVPLEAAGVAVGLGLALTGTWLLLARPGTGRAPRRGPSAGSLVAAVGLVAACAVVLFPTHPLGEASPAGARALTGAAVLLVWLTSTYVLAVAWAEPLGERAGPLRAGLLRAGSATAVGLGLIVPLLVYQLDYDVPLGFPNRFVVLAAVAVLAAGGLRRPLPAPVAGAADVRAADVRAADAAAPGAAPSDRPASDVPASDAAERIMAVRSAQLLAGAVAVATVAAAAWGGGKAVPSTQDRPAQLAHAQDRATGTIALLDWNLHYGVTQDPGLDLGRMAAAIRGSGAQVVTLQEVSRGWVMGGGADMLTFLERATGFRAVAAPAADRQFVNALLVDPALLGDDGAFGAAERVVRTRLPYGDGPQWRSAVTATVHVPGIGTPGGDDEPGKVPDPAAAGGARPLVVTSAHLQHRDENTPTRLAQLDVLLAADIASSPAAVLAGDLNSEPGWAEIGHVTSRGFTSAQDVAGDPSHATFPAWAPDVRIDWVFGRGVTFTDVQVMPDDGSDHRGILATLDLAPGVAATSDPATTDPAMPDPATPDPTAPRTTAPDPTAPASGADG